MNTLFGVLIIGLIGYAIGELGRLIRFPFWIILILTAIFGWILGGIV